MMNYLLARSFWSILINTKGSDEPFDAIATSKTQPLLFTCPTTPTRLGLSPFCNNPPLFTGADAKTDFPSLSLMSR